MPSERTLSIFSGIAQGLEKATNNLVNISAKKEELRIEREKFAQDKKIKDAQLKKYEIETSTEAVAEARENHKMEVRAANAVFDLNQAKIGKAQMDWKKEEIKLNDELKLRADAEVSSMKEQGYTGEEAISYLLSPERPSGVASVDNRTVTTAPPGYGQASMARERGDTEDVEDPFLKQLGAAGRAESGRTIEGSRKEIRDKDKKPEKLTENKRTVLGIVRKMKGDNEALETLIDYIRGEEYEPEEFEEELKGYNTSEEEAINTQGYFDEEDSPVNRRNFMGIGQKRDRRTKDGIMYEKKEDGLWHPLS